MKTSMQNYKKRLVVLNVMLLVVVLLAGVSYAVFTGYSSQTDTNTLAASCMDLEFSGTNEINLTNSYPIIEAKGLEQTPYTFTIKNKCDNYIEYYVIASVINASTSVDSKYIKVSLLGDNDMSPSVITSLKQISTPQSLSSYNIKENYVLKEGDGITKDESRSFDFRMWLDGENETSWTSEDLENKTYQVKISVVGTVKTKPKDDLFIATTIDGKASSTFPTTNGYSASVSCIQNDKIVDIGATIKWTGSKWSLGVTNLTSGNTKCTAIFTKSNTLSDLILSGNGPSSPTTVPGKDLALTEALIATTPDDYGTSYYFRGNVQNNYVQFANKCWRIVRITGNGAIKIILYNNNSSNISNPCSTNNNSGINNNAFAGTSAYNTNNDYNAYIGFMYGIANSSNNTGENVNVNKSTILTNLESWYKSNLLSYDDKLVDVIWCNDKSFNTDASYIGLGWTSTPSSGLAFAKNITYYNSTKRLVSSSGAAGGTGPSLVCSNYNDNSLLSKFTVSDTTNGNGALTYKIGLLTADEMAFAGYARGGSASVYLNDNVNSYWWTMSPSVFGGGTASVWGIYGTDENTIGAYDVSSVFGIRPVVALDSNTIASGSGSAESPFIIQ